MKTGTRERLLEQAEILFSQKGFYGTSINDVAAEVRVSKQALLHHFASKEKLYAAVLEKVKEHLDAFIQEAKATSVYPIAQLKHIFTSMSNADDKSLRVIALLLRELIDNRERAESAHKWYMRPFLDELEDMAKAAQQRGALLGLHPLAFIYQLLGATHYYVVSRPTLKQLYSADEFDELEHQHARLIEQLLS